MKTTVKTTIAILIGLPLFFSSCKKYEEGPALSLRSKKERVANTWEIEKAYDDGEDVTDNYDQFELQMLNNNEATLVAIYTYGDFTFEYVTNGYWSFDNNKEDLVLDFEDDNADERYQILRLKEDELWLREKGDDLELHLKTK